MSRTPAPGGKAAGEAVSGTLREALRRVIDPESGLNIVDMGLIAAIDARTEPVQVRLVMTSAACPMASLIAEQAQAELEAVLGQDRRVEVWVVDEPRWHPRRMSPAARAQMGWTDADIDALDGPDGPDIPGASDAMPGTGTR